MNKQESSKLFKLLDERGIWYLDFYNYNNEEKKDLPDDLKTIYDQLFDMLIQPTLDKIPYDISETMNFNFFGKENGKWYAVWYEPEIEMPIEDFFNGKALAELLDN